MTKGSSIELQDDIAKLRKRINELETELDHLRNCRHVEDIGRDHIVSTDAPPRSTTSDESDLHLQQTAEMANLGYWVWDDIENCLEYCSAELAQLFGYSVDEYVKRFAAGIENEHMDPDDLERYRSETDRAGQECRPYIIEYRERTASGKMGVFREHGHPILDDNGQLIRTIGIVQDVTEHKEALEAARQSEMLGRQAAKLAKLGHWVWDDIENRLEYCSEELAQLYGLTVDEYVERFSSADDNESVHPADHGVYARAIKESRENLEPYVVEFRDFTATGEVRHFSEYGEPILDDEGRLIKTVGTLQDITEHKEALEIVRRNETTARQAASIAKLGHWVWDEIEDRQEYCSEGLAQIFGYSVDEYNDRFVKGNEDADLHPEDRERYLRELDAAREEVRPHHIEFRERNANGEYRHFREVGEPLLDSAGRHIKTIGVVQDITEQQEALETLRQSETLFHQAATIAKLGHWVWDEVENRIEYCSEELAHVYGYTLNEFRERLASGLENANMHPDDLERYECEVAAARDEARPYSVEFRERIASGELHRFREVGEPILDDNGRLVKSIGIVQDITEQKQALEMLSQSEKKYRTLVEGSIQGIIIHRNMYPLFANDACANILGFDTADEICALDDLTGLVHPDDRQALRQRLAARSRNEDVESRNIVRFLRHDGTTVWLENFATMIEWEGQSATLATFIDVTERIQAQEKQARAHDELERRVRDRTADLETINTVLQREIHERKQTEERLAASEERLRKASRLAGLGHYVWDSVDDRCLVCSDEQARIHGTTPDAYIARASNIDGSLSFTHPEDRVAYAAEVTKMRQTGKGFENEHRAITTDGKTRYLHEIVQPVLDPKGKVILELGVTQDVTERRQAEQALRERELQLREAHQIAKLGHWRWDPKTDFMTISPELSAILGLANTEPCEIEYQTYLNRFIHPEDRDWVEKDLDLPEEPGVLREAEYRLLLAGGETRWVHDILRTVTDEHGRYAAEIGTTQDITDRKLAEQKIRDSEARLARALRQSKLAYWSYDFGKERITDWSCEAAEILGITKQELPVENGDYLNWVHPDDRAAVAACYTSEDPENLDRVDYQIEYRIKGPGGSYIWLHEMAEIERDAAGVPVGFTGAIQDITSRKLAELALRDSEQRFRSLVDNSPSAIYLKDVNGRFQMANQQFESWYGISADDAIGKTSHDLFVRELADQYVAMDRQVLESGRASVQEVDAPFASDGLHTVLATKFPVLAADGNISGIGTINTDITETKNAEAALAEQRELLETIINAADIAISVKDKDSRLLFVNAYHANFSGLTPEQMIGKTPTEATDQASGQFIHSLDRRALDSDLPVVRFEYSSTDYQGKEHSWLTTKTVIRSDNGAMRYIVTAAVDLTELKARENDLRQAQKMDALGKLTSGIAHDFNNLLLLINANLIALEKEDPSKQEVQRAAGSIRLAADTANNLTSSLMSFSRDQPLAPDIVDLPETIERTVKSLFRTLTSDMQIVTHYKGGIKTVLIDARYLENALLNLALNARDAMHDNRRLTITVENHDSIGTSPIPGLPDGDFVKVAVADRGGGMTPEVLEQAMQPFFTTKGQGSGTGLGLSMVYRFVKQSGGHLEIESQPGEGTTVKMYLPQAHADLIENDEVRSDEIAFETHGQTVLVTEDDKPVRQATVSLLRELGLRVLEAANADQAIAVLKTDLTVDLLFSDIYLRGSIDGYRLAAKAQEIRPDLKIAFCSGNASQPAPDANGVVAPLLRKPYTPDDVKRMIGLVLQDTRTVN